MTESISIKWKIIENIYHSFKAIFHTTICPRSHNLKHYIVHTYHGHYLFIFREKLFVFIITIVYLSSWKVLEMFSPHVSVSRTIVLVVCPYFRGGAAYLIY